MLKTGIPLIVFGVIVTAAAFVPINIKENYDTNSLEGGNEDVTEWTPLDMEDRGKMFEVFGDAEQIPEHLHHKLDPNYWTSERQQYQRKYETNRAAELPPKHRPRFGG